MNVGTIEIVILRCKNDADEFGSPAVSPRIALARPPSKASSKHARVQSADKARAPSAKAASEAIGGLGGMMGLFDGACDELEPGSSISGLDGADDYGKPVGPEGYVYPVPPPGMGWDSARGRFASLETLLPEDRHRAAAAAACGMSMDDRSEVRVATSGPRVQTLPVTEPPDSRATYHTQFTDQDPNAQLDGHGDPYNHPWIYINQFGPGGRRGENDMRGDMHFGAQGAERQQMKQSTREMGYAVSMSNAPIHQDAPPMGRMPPQQYTGAQVFPSAPKPRASTPAPSQQGPVVITEANVAQYWTEQQMKLKRAHEMKAENERIVASFPTSHPQHHHALRMLSLLHDAIESSEATCQQLMEDAKNCPAIYEALRQIGAVQVQRPTRTPTQVHFMEEVGQGVYNPGQHQAPQTTKINYDHDWSKDTDSEVAAYWGGKRRPKPNVGHSNTCQTPKSPNPNSNQIGGWNEQQQPTSKNEQGIDWGNQQDQSWAGKDNAAGDAWGNNDAHKGGTADQPAVDGQQSKSNVRGGAAPARSDVAKDDNNDNVDNDWVTVDKKSMKPGGWSGSNSSRNQAGPRGNPRSEKTGSDVSKLPDNQSPNNFIKPYFKGWNGAHCRSGSVNQETRNITARSPYNYPAPPMPSIPEGKAPGVSHAVVPGKGAEYVHRTNSPEYIDSMEAPYAVFAFKYRSPAVLEKITRLDVRNDTAATVQEVEKERLASLPKDQLVAELMKMKVSSGGRNSSQEAAYVKVASAWAGDGDKKSKAAGWGGDAAGKAPSNAGEWNVGGNEKPASQNWTQPASIRDGARDNQENFNNNGSPHGKFGHTDRNSTKSKGTSNALWPDKENAAPITATGWDTSPAAGGRWDGSAEAGKMAAAPPTDAYPTPNPAYTANYAAYAAEAAPRFTTGTTTNATSGFRESIASGFEQDQVTVPDYGRGRGRGGLRGSFMHGRGGYGRVKDTYERGMEGGGDAYVGGRGGGRGGRGGRAQSGGGYGQYGQVYDAYAIAMQDPGQIPAGVPVDRSGLPYADPHAGWSKRPAPPPSVVPHASGSDPMAKCEQGPKVQEGPEGW